MTTTLTPPPAGSPAPVPPSDPRSSSRVIAILAICFGTVLIIGAVFTGVFTAVRAAAQQTSTLTADAAGITGLNVDVGAADFTIVYAGAEVTLDVTGNAGDWHLTRDGGTLDVTTDRGWWGGWRFFGDGDTAVLTLPERLKDTRMDADFSLGAGVLRAEGTYGELELDLGAGSIDVSGSAESLDADISAGRAVFDLADVDQVRLQVSAGGVTGTLTGTAPSDVAIDVSAGRLELTLPDTTYALATDVSAGDLEHTLSTDPASDNRITASVSAGFVKLTPSGR